jgi:pimeloyl-ACP methyl ester carboxylesterase
MRETPQEPTGIDLHRLDTEDRLTICLVHGSWHDGSCFELVQPKLEQRGYRTEAPTLPIDQPEANFETYAEVVSDHIVDPANTVLVVHSRMGNIGPRVAIRKAVRQIVYLCSGFDRSNNRTLSRQYRNHFRQPVPEKYNPAFKQAIELDKSTGVSTFDRDSAMEFFYHDCKPDVAAKFAAQLRPMYRPEVQPPIEDWTQTPTGFIYGSQDEVIRQQYYEYVSNSEVIARNLGRSAIALDGGHSLHLSQPDELASALDSVVIKRTLIKAK